MHGHCSNSVLTLLYEGNPPCCMQIMVWQQKVDLVLLFNERCDFPCGVTLEWSSQVHALKDKDHLNNHCCFIDLDVTYQFHLQLCISYDPFAFLYYISLTFLINHILMVIWNMNVSVFICSLFFFVFETNWKAIHKSTTLTIKLFG